MREIDQLTHKIVGTRREARLTWSDVDRLQTTIRELRGSGLARRGLYRFASFEEAQEWMIRQMASLSKSAPPTSMTSCGSQELSKQPEPTTS